MSTMILEVYDALKAAGAPEDKAQAAATVLANADNRFDKVDSELARLEAKMDAKFEKVDGKLESLEQRLVIRLGGMFIVAVGIILAAIRYLPPASLPPHG